MRVYGRTCIHAALTSAAVDVGVVGLQAFYQASAFNVNIGGWNTASVTTLSSVCALSAVAHIAARNQVQTLQWPGADVCEFWPILANRKADVRESWRRCRFRLFQFADVTAYTCSPQYE